MAFGPTMEIFLKQNCSFAQQGAVDLDEPPDSTEWLFEDIEEGFLDSDAVKTPLEYPPQKDHKTIQETEAQGINQDESQRLSDYESRNTTNDVPPNQAIEFKKRNLKIIPLFLIAVLMTLPHLPFSFEVLPIYYKSIILLMMIIILSRLVMSGINRGRVVQPEEQDFYAGVFVNAVLCVYFSWKVIDLGFLLTLFLGIGHKELLKDEYTIFKDTSPLALDFLSIKYLHPICMMLQASCVLTVFL